jgi:formate dehydrogenase subunit delta
MQPDKLVMMANQIAAFFAAQGEERAVPQIADHIAKFWDPRMRRAIAEHLDRGGAGLDPLAKAALGSIAAGA